MLRKHTTNNKFSIIHRCCYSIMLLCYLLLLLLLGEGIASFTLAILLPLRRLQQSYGFTPWGAGKMAWLETAEMTLPAGNLSGASSFYVSSELISFCLQPLCFFTWRDSSVSVKLCHLLQLQYVIRKWIRTKQSPQGFLNAAATYCMQVYMIVLL